jgi:uncharacterized membrane protein
MTTIADLKTMRRQALLWLEAGLVNDEAYLRLSHVIEAQLSALRPDASQRRAFAARLLFLGGVSLVIAGVVYFVAANWRGMPRGYKIALLFVGMVVAYATGGAYLYRKRADPVTGRLLVIAGSWLFGISLALIGQIYNSHADSWRLFAVWASPCIALTWLLRSAYFSIKSLLLLNLGVWLLLFPASSLQLPKENLPPGLIAIAVFNGLIFAGASLKSIEWTKGARYVAYTAMQIFLFALTMLGDEAWWSLFFSAVLIGAVWGYIQVKLDEWLVYITLIVGAVWTFVKLFQWAAPRIQDNLAIALIFFGSGWLGVNALVFLWIGNRIRRKKAEI